MRNRVREGSPFHILLAFFGFLAAAASLRAQETEERLEPLEISTEAGAQFAQDRDRFSKAFPFVLVNAESRMWNDTLYVLGSFALTSQKSCVDLGSGSGDCRDVATSDLLKTEKSLKASLGLAWDPVRSLRKNQKPRGHRLLLVARAGVEAIDLSLNQMPRSDLLGLRLVSHGKKFNGAYYELGAGETRSFGPYHGDGRIKFDSYFPFGSMQLGLGGGSKKVNIGLSLEADIGPDWPGRQPKLDTARVMVLLDWDYLGTGD